MSIARPRTLTVAWATLVAITTISVATAELLELRAVAVAAIMAISAAKVAIILWRFMDVGEAPIGIRIYMLCWPVVCGAMIYGLYAIA